LFTLNLSIVIHIHFTVIFEILKQIVITHPNSLGQSP